MTEFLNYILTTGDFPGYAYGMEEDHPLVILLLTLHTLFF